MDESVPTLAADAKKRPAAEPDVADRYRVYPGRYYVLVALALLAGQQALSWMTFGTIPNESYVHFGLTDVEVTLLSGTEPFDMSSNNSHNMQNMYIQFQQCAHQQHAAYH